MMQLSQAPLPSLPHASSEAERPLDPSRPARDRDIRLRKHADYQRVYKATRKQFSTSMSWFLAVRPPPDGVSGPRVGLTAGKVLGKAHERNRIKRRVREAVRHAIHELPDGIDLILHPKRSVMTMDFGKLEAEVLRIFRQASTQVREAAKRDAQSGVAKAEAGNANQVAGRAMESRLGNRS
jgi:ribonuclease P protein component